MMPTSADGANGQNRAAGAVLAGTGADSGVVGGFAKRVGICYNIRPLAKVAAAAAEWRVRRCLNPVNQP